MAEYKTGKKENGLEIQDFIAELTSLEKDRQPWEARWQDFATYILPRRQYKHQTDQGRTIGKQVFSSRAVEACKIFGEGLLGYGMSPQQRWFQLMVNHRNLNNDYDVQLWLQLVEEALYTAINKSNFYDEAIEFFKDGGAFGTAYMFSEEIISERKIRFRAEHYYKLYIKENVFGQVDTIYMKQEYTAKQAMERFGKKVSTKIQDAYDNKRYGQKFKFVHCVKPRKLRDETKRNAENMPYMSVWFEEGEEEILKESGFNTNPWVVWRLTKSSGESYGRGLGDSAYPNILTANQIAKDMLKISQKLADPPVVINGDFRRRVSLDPAAKNYTAKNAPNGTVQPIYTYNQYPVGIEQQERVESTIDRLFMVDFFLMLARSERNITATEVLEKQGEKAAILGSLTGRLNTEVFDPIIKRIYQIESDAGRLPPPPQILIDNLEGAEIEVDYFGPLAQIQKRQFKTQGIQQSLAAVIPLSQVDPKVLDVVNLDGATKELLEAYNAPQEMINDPKTIAAIRAQRAQQIAEQQAKEDAAQQADMAPKLGKAPEPGSPLEQGMQNAGV